MGNCTAQAWLQANINVGVGNQSNPCVLKLQAYAELRLVD